MADVLAFRDAVAATDPELHGHIVTAIDVVAKAIHVFRRRPALVFSFNGGKDSTVVLHIIRAALLVEAAGRPPPASGAEAAAPLALPMVYFDSPNPNFPEVLEFMRQCERQLGAPVRHLAGFKGGLEALIAEGTQAVIMGTRSTDPDGAGLEHFSPTSLNWPPAVRVCPVLHWHYVHVWRFLRGVGLPYCSLYDRGYTSLGSLADSVPNPLLLASAAAAAAAPYLPAYMLTKDADAHERLGRAGAAAVAAAAAAAAAAARPERQAATAAPQPSAAIVVVGDELLDGRVRDANGAFLCVSLSARGVRVAEVSVVPDDAEAVAAAVRRLAPLHTYVITTGGLGPTLDDVTMLGVGRAFGYRARRCGAFAQFLRALAAATAAGGGANAAAGVEHSLRMADLPFGADVTLLYPDGSSEPAFPVGAATEDVDAAATADAASSAVAPLPPSLLQRGYPLARVHNVYIFPGIPSILRRKWRAHAGIFAGPRVAARSLRVRASEAAVAALLEAVAAAHPAVKVGCYPSDEDAFTAQLHGLASPSLLSSPPPPPPFSAPPEPPALLLGTAAAAATTAAATGTSLRLDSIPGAPGGSAEEPFPVLICLSSVGGDADACLETALAHLLELLARAGVRFKR